VDMNKRLKQTAFSIIIKMMNNDRCEKKKRRVKQGIECKYKAFLNP